MKKPISIKKSVCRPNLKVFSPFRIHQQLTRISRQNPAYLQGNVCQPADARMKIGLFFIVLDSTQVLFLPRICYSDDFPSQTSNEVGATVCRRISWYWYISILIYALPWVYFIAQKTITFLFDIIINDSSNFFLPYLQTIKVDIVLKMY